MKTIDAIKWTGISGFVIFAASLFSSLCFGYSGGDGSEEKPYGIESKVDLLTLAASTRDYVKCFILKADIDLTGEYFTSAVIAPDTNQGTFGFEGVAFTGVFDGNGHKICNLKITGGSYYVGLFGFIDTAKGMIKNLGLINVVITGSKTVGGLAGENHSVISSCHVTGQVSGYDNMGGLVGENFGTIQSCYSTVVMDGRQIIGGLVGENSGVIRFCYATGKVSADYTAGGLVGHNYQGKVIQCYSTGRPTALLYVGGLCGSVNTCGEYEDTGNFWDIETSRTPVSEMGIGRPTAQMKNPAMFIGQGWDLIDTWGIVKYQTYPCLRVHLAADLNRNGEVNMMDFSILASQWLKGI